MDFKLRLQDLIFNIAAQYDYERPFPKIMAMDTEYLYYSFHCAICLYHFIEMDKPAHYHYPVC